MLNLSVTRDAQLPRQVEHFLHLRIVLNPLLDLWPSLLGICAFGVLEDRPPRTVCQLRDELCRHARLLKVARQFQSRHAEAAPLFRLGRLNRLRQRLGFRGIVPAVLRGTLTEQVAELRLQLLP